MLNHLVTFDPFDVTLEGQRVEIKVWRLYY
jgi:hypothetical protein